MKGAAWSMPMLAVAIAAPARAASGEVLIGEFYESSASISNQTVNLSAIYVECIDGQETPWLGQEFTATITISYTGSNSAFTFEPTVNQSPQWQMTVSPTEITLTTTVTPSGCGEGSSYFPPVALSFNAANVDPGEGTIEVQGSAVSEDGRYVVEPLIDRTPCSPTFDKSPIVGPRVVPPSC